MELSVMSYGNLCRHAIIFIGIQIKPAVTIPMANKELLNKYNYLNGLPTFFAFTINYR